MESQVKVQVNKYFVHGLSFVHAMGQSCSCPDVCRLNAHRATILAFHNVDFKIIMYSMVHELKAPFLLSLIQTLTKFAMGKFGSCPDVHRLNAHRFIIA